MFEVVLVCVCSFECPGGGVSPTLMDNFEIMNSKMGLGHSKISKVPNGLYKHIPCS